MPSLTTARPFLSPQILTTLHETHVQGGAGAQFVFVVGDQQTYDRMTTLIREQPLRFSWVVPLPGEFHFCAHVAVAFTTMYYGHLLAWAAKQCGCEKVIKSGDHDVTNYDHYDRFLQLVAVAALTVLSEVVPDHLLSSPRTLLLLTECNAGETGAATWRCLRR